MPNPPAPLDDVLYQLALASRCPDAETINDFVRRFKEHAREIVELAADLALEANRMEHGDDTEPSATETSAVVSRALSAFQSHLGEAPKGEAPKGEVP